MKRQTKQTKPKDQSTERPMRVYAAWHMEGEAESVAVMLGRVLSREAEDAGEDAAQYFGLSEFDKDGEDTGSDCVGSHFTDGEVSVLLHPLGGKRWILCMAGRADGLKNPGITPPLLSGEGVTFGGDSVSDRYEGMTFGSMRGTAEQALAQALKGVRKCKPKP